MRLTREKELNLDPEIYKSDLTRECIYEIRKDTPIDESTKRKTYRASLSSEQVVERWFGKEKLIHTNEAIVLDRAKNNGLPLLFNHNSDEPIGKVRNISLKDGRVSGDVIFGNSQRAQETEADVNDGLLDGVSIGYRILKIEEDTENDVFNVTKWELLEASIAPVPADSSVGVGRNEQGNYNLIVSTPGTNIDPNIQTYQTTDMQRVSDKPNEANPVDDSKRANNSVKTSNDKRASKMEDEINIEDIQNKARDEEQRRIREITALGDRFQKRELAQEHIKRGSSIDDFRQQLIEVINPNPQPLLQPAAEDTTNLDIGMSEREIKQFSFCRALAYLSEPNNPRMQELAAFEIDCSRAAAEINGKRSQGLQVPNQRDWFLIDKRTGTRVNKEISERAVNFSIPMDVFKRDLTAGTATQGQELVSTDLLAGSFIDVLRNLLVVRAAGATMLTDLQGDIAIPRKTSASSAVWVAENAAVSQSDMAFDQVTLSPKTCGSYTEYTRQLLLQSSLSVENLVRTDLAVGLATAIDLAALYGTGASGQPTGVLNTSGINTVAAFTTTGSPTYAELVGMESAVAVDNALLGTLSYIVEPTMRGTLKTTEKATNTAQFVWEPGNTVNGYSTWTTNQMTTNDVFFANWRDLLLGFWGGLSLLVDPYTNSLSGTIRVVGHQSVDVAVRHPVSFCYGV